MGINCILKYNYKLNLLSILLIIKAHNNVSYISYV